VAEVAARQRLPTVAVAGILVACLRVEVPGEVVPRVVLQALLVYRVQAIPPVAVAEAVVAHITLAQVVPGEVVEMVGQDS